MIELTQADDGTSRSLSVGGEVLLRLPENPTTGFQWQFTVSGSGLDVVEDRYDVSGGAPGAAGVRIMRYVARRTGTVTVEAVYKQAWESAVHSRHRFTIVVV